MAKSVQMARGIIHRWRNPHDWEDGGWLVDAWPTYLWAKRYLRRHGQWRK